jgi:hypothetical protein
MGKVVPGLNYRTLAERVVASTTRRPRRLRVV